MFAFADSDCPAQLRNVFIIMISLFISLLGVRSVYSRQIVPVEQDSRVSYELVSRSDPRQVEPHSDGATIEFSSVTINENDDLGVLLLKRGILPTTDAYSLIYKANPEIEDLSRIRSAVEIKLPVLVGPKAQYLLREGKLASLTVDADARRALVEAIEEFTASAIAFKNITPSIKDPDLLKTAGAHTIQRINLILRLIKSNVQENTRPFDRQLLNHVRAEVAAGTRITGRLIKRGRLARKDYENLESFRQDLELSAESFSSERGDDTPPPKWRKQLVYVRIRRAGSSAEVSFFRVRYEPKALYEDEPEKEYEEIEQSSPNAKKELPEGRYYFWTLAEGSNSKVGDAKFYEIRKRADNQPLIIELIVP